MLASERLALNITFCSVSPHQATKEMPMMRTHLLILILVIIRVSGTVDYVCPYQVENCTCEFTTVTCHNLHALPPLTTTDTITYTFAKFDEGSITDIPDNSLPPGLTSLVIKDNPLSNISDDAFNASENTLNSLSFINTKLTKLPDAFRKLNNLTSLAITDTNIEDWNTDVLQRMSVKLYTLELQNVGSIAWPNTFSFQHSVTTFIIKQSSVTYLSDRAFIASNNTLMVVIYLESCNLTQVPTALSVPRNVMQLTLNNNKITSVDAESGIGQLNVFPLGGTLQYLAAKSNGLTVLPHLPNLTNLIILDLSFNQITEISLDSLPPNLNTLNLEFNNIIKVTDPHSVAKSGLRFLDLDSNPITTISPAAFTTVTSIKQLGIRNTSLTQIPDAVTSLNEVIISLQNTISLNCSSPPSLELCSWIIQKRSSVVVDGACSNGMQLDTYLQSSCQTYVTTQPLTTTDIASTIVCSASCIICWLFLLFSAYLFQSE